MLVDLRTVAPNPMRDFTIDPIDEEAVEALTTSSQEDGFWGGVVCRRAPDGTIQIGAGHHRVRAALAAGITTAEVCVSEMDDAAMIRVYARENATQRGGAGTALAGAVASALKFLIKAVLMGGCGEFTTSSHSLAELRGNLRQDAGLAAA
jgi:ParB/RepB/Spo0J family partition protein